MIEIYADGAYSPVVGQGGWGVVVVENGQKQVFSGMVKSTTSNRMEISAALEGILKTPQGSEIVVYTDSQYVFGCVSKGWQRRANRDLWEELDAAVSQRKVSWEWIDQSARNPLHQEAHALATSLASEAETRQPVPSVKRKERLSASRYSVQSPKAIMSTALSEVMSVQTLRIIDASLNRIGEGLRFLEEIARMLLDDAGLTEELKTLRHDLIRGDVSFQARLLQSRDSVGDVGIDIEVSGEEKGKELPILLVANARRVQESLRVLEELTKLPGLPPELDSAKFKHARFNLYTIEQKLMSRLLGQEKAEK